MEDAKPRAMPRWWILPLLVTAACTRPPPPDWPTSSPAELCRDPSLEEDDFCLPGARIERVLRDGELRITHAAASSTGVTAPSKLRIEAIIDGAKLSFNAKFKPAPVPDGDVMNNSPRREIAAYELQKLFLDEDDWVVPPTVLRCLDLDRHGEWLDQAEPWPETGCVLGVLAFWLDHVTGDDVLDGERFKRDAAYRHHVSNANVLTTLIGHQDSLGENIVVSTDPARPRVFAIDNGLAFEAMGINPVALISSAWADMRVPVVPERTAARLQKLHAADLERLRAVAQMKREGRRLEPVPVTPPMSPDEGVRREGDVIQWGLTVDETKNVHKRLIDLIAAIQKRELEEIGQPAAGTARRAP